VRAAKTGSMTDIIAKTFDPAEIEARLYAHWESTGAFRPDRPDATPFTIVIPPPNVTGSLHIGHALDNTLQDVLIRYHRLKGRDALWVVGTDHAGIATQMVVERQLAESTQGPKRADMSRDDFLAHVWEWKATSGGQITRQLRRLGASCDWAHERFTMDEGFSAAVTKVFVDLYNEGLLYRDKRLVNWDPALKTAISDLEVEYREIDGHMWHFRYPLADGPDGEDRGYIAIATTRPETILGDGAVAVNPNDDRYRHLVGTFAKLPLVDRLLPIVADDYVEADFGSGAVKITAAHDFNDFALAGRHPAANIPLINLMNPDGTMSDACPEAYRGLTREAARKQVVADFDAMGLLDKVEPHKHQVPYGDRSGVVIEPFLTDQWYVDAATLAKPAIEAVRSGKTRFVPANWDKTYFNWMENIQPWCVSRQITWGHRIPAWYGRELDAWTSESTVSGAAPSIRGQEFVAANELEAIKLAARVYNKPVELISVVASFEEALTLGLKRQLGDETEYIVRDNDVLDTWFSSALWPFGTLGWPEESARVSRYYPGDVLVTGFDIIFFWVARMMMQGLHFMGEVPFATVYCHGLVRDAKGAKMSKSKGNTVDPLALIDRYGADALRFTLTAMESQGRDIKLDEKRVEGYRNFATKLWNAARFCQSNGIAGSTAPAPPAATAPVNRWIIGEVVRTATALDAAIAAYRFDGYAETAYQFVWSRFCDWYLELTKPLLAAPAEGASQTMADAAVAAETRAVTGWALDQILVMLHPVMPFLTEELWHKLGSREHDLIVAAWPVTDAGLVDSEAAADIDWLIGLVTEVRSARNELNIPPGAKLGFELQNAAPATEARYRRNAAAIERLARIVRSEGASVDVARMQVVDGEATVSIPLGGVIDIAAERARLEKNAATAEKERDALTARLASPGFVDKAKPEAVDKARADLAARAAEAERLRAALARLG
jgi:valyl-tRNA synthetase